MERRKKRILVIITSLLLVNVYYVFIAPLEIEQEKPVIKIEKKINILLKERQNKNWSEQEINDMLTTCSSDFIRMDKNTRICKYRNKTMKREIIIEIIRKNDLSFDYTDISHKEHVFIGNF